MKQEERDRLQREDIIRKLAPLAKIIKTQNEKSPYFSKVGGTYRPLKVPKKR